MSDPSTAIITALASIVTSLILVFGAQRLQAKTEAKRGDADALKVVQDVLANVGGVYDQLIDHVRDSVEGQMKLAYQNKIDDLGQRVSELEAEQAAWLEERREWEIGIGLLLAQIGELNRQPRWKPKNAYMPGAKPSEAHGFQT